MASAHRQFGAASTTTGRILRWFGVQTTLKAGACWEIQRSEEESEEQFCSSSCGSSTAAAEEAMSDNSIKPDT